MRLEDKITSEAEYDAVELPEGNGRLNRNYRTSSGYATSGFTPAFQTFVCPHGSTRPVAANYAYIPHRLWWMHRELLRQALGIYSTRTAALAFIAQYPQFGIYMPHISREDPDKIAYTPTPADGVADRQVRITLGRFLRKFDPLLPDDVIANIEAWHRSELNPEVELINAMENPKEFVKAYRSINSCMSKEKAAYGETGGKHPVEVYCAPGFHLAVLKNESGGYSARCLVWINPSDPQDKRAVRVYGDITLHTWLKRNGFAFKAFTGAFLHTDVLKKGSGTSEILMAYVDSGANFDDPQDLNSSGVWDGNNRVYLLSSKTKNKVPAEFQCATQTTSGRVSARPYNVEVVDIITGAKINRLDAITTDVFVDGKFGPTIKRPKEFTEVVKLRYDKQWYTAFASSETPKFSHGGVFYLEDRDTRESLGYYKLDAELYPDRQDWCSDKDTTVTHDNKRILTEDRVFFIDEAKITKLYHRTLVPRDGVRVAQIADTKTWAHPSVEVVTTAANRKVVPGVHAVAQAYDGTWNYTRHMRQATVWGTKVWVSADTDIVALESSGEIPPVIAGNIRKAAAVGSTADLQNLIFTSLNDRGDCLVYVRDEDTRMVVMGYVFEPREINIEVLRAAVSNDPPDSMAATRKQQHARLKRILDAFDAAIPQPAAVAA